MFKNNGKSLKIGSTDISTIKLGSTDISKIYVGTDVVFEKESKRFYFIKDGVFMNDIAGLSCVLGDGYVQFGVRSAGAKTWMSFSMTPRNASLGTRLVITAASPSAADSSTGMIDAGFLFSSDTLVYQDASSKPGAVWSTWSLGYITSTFQTYTFDQALGDEIYFSDYDLYYGIGTTLSDLRIKNLYIERD